VLLVVVRLLLLLLRVKGTQRKHVRIGGEGREGTLLLLLLLLLVPIVLLLLVLVLFLEVDIVHVHEVRVVLQRQVAVLQLVLVHRLLVLKVVVAQEGVRGEMGVLVRRAQLATQEKLEVAHFFLLINSGMELGARG